MNHLGLTRIKSLSQTCLLRRHGAILLILLALLAGTALVAAAEPAKTVALRKEFADTLSVLVESLENLQLKEGGADKVGALECQHCGILHTRAAEAVFPMVVMFEETGDECHLRAARKLASWLIRLQEPDGSWKETPEEWTGTTTDQLLMFVLAYEKIADRLPPEERTAWLRAIEGATDYLAEVMTPEFASINYCATTTASLAAAHRIVPKPRYLERARALAHDVVARMDEDGMLDGEGGKCHGIKMGIDLGYSLEMSLWGLAHYARLTGDAEVGGIVRAALRTHLFFIYPDGSMDGSWGIRSNKWTTYGSGTSDGCQVLFMLHADEDPVYPSAAFRNLEFLRTNIRNGLVDYGPHHARVLAGPPCIYPTFAKAKNLAMAMQFETRPLRSLVPLPTQVPGWQRHFKTVDVVATRTAAFMATITAYGYKDIAKGPDSKYMFRPSGGSMSYLWLEGHGMLQASSQSEYHRWEPMHFPAAEGVRPLTPRIEYSKGPAVFTNLFEFDGQLEAGPSESGGYVVSTYGQLKDRDWHYGGVSYRFTHHLRDDTIRKEVTLFYRGARPEARIVEPIIWNPAMTFVRSDERTIRVQGAGRPVTFRLVSGNARLVAGRNADQYWSVYPALRAYPIELEVAPIEGRRSTTLVYEISLAASYSQRQK